MKTLLLPMAVSILISLPTIALAQEPQPSGQEHEVNQSEQQDKFKHDHRKNKGLPSATQSNAADNEQNSDTKEKKKLHDHKEVHK
tara:strand:+ start:699 stop:953 length:255 start_codon:yes stop_codon:yes gene_type:complete